MAVGIKRKVANAQKRIERQIAAHINRDSIYSRGMAYEGYNGGYRDALSDVLLALNGVQPRRNGWWDEDLAKVERNRAEVEGAK